MMNRLRRKLASRRGASITFALLLFLVCTVIGVIVLVAATAAAGRMSRLAESDARYYAVNSAAQLLREEIENETVTVTQTRTVPCTITTTTYSDNAKVVQHVYADEEGYAGTGTITSTGSIEGESTFAFLNSAAKYCTFDASEPPAYTATLWARDGDNDPITAEIPSPLQTFTMSLSDSSNTALEAPTVTVTATLTAWGELLLTLSCTEGKSGGTYTATMHFTTHDDWDYNYGDRDPDTGSASPGATVASSTATTDNVSDSRYDVFTWEFTGLTIGTAS